MPKVNHWVDIGIELSALARCGHAPGSVAAVLLVLLNGGPGGAIEDFIETGAGRLIQRC